MGAGGISTLLTRLLIIGGEDGISSPSGRRIFAPRIIIAPPAPLPGPKVTPPSEPIEPLVVLTTWPNDAAAARIARELVESGLAACVNRVGAVHSTYRWQGAIHDEPEVLLVIKTLSIRYSELEMRLKSLHPYDVPEIIALPVARTSAEYLAWLVGTAGT